jgi:GntR family transcriptional regulator
MGMEFRGAQPIYVQVADYYGSLIDRGAFKPGSFLPSVREVAVAEGINPNTVARAFQTLEERGYVRAIAKKGYEVTGGKKTRDAALDQEIDRLLKDFSIDEVEAALQRAKGDGR